LILSWKKVTGNRPSRCLTKTKKNRKQKRKTIII